MIFDQLTLHNFGVYRDRQTIALTPPSPDRPIVLFGGLNGNGKTTILDAIQLALYGKRSRCSTRGALAYEEFLERSIHRDVDPHEGAGVELTFRRREAGTEATYRVHRSWASNGRAGVREILEVWKADRFDKALTDAWSSQVEEFVPLAVSNLFFFDGEQVERLADIDNAREVLGASINSLLGLGLVDQLANDLLVLDQRKRLATKPSDLRSQIEQERERVKALADRRQEAQQAVGEAQNRVDRAERALEELKARLRREGADLLGERSTLQSERESCVARLSELESRLRDLAAGPLPFAVVSNLLKEALSHAAASQERVLDERLMATLRERDEALLSFLRNQLRRTRPADLVERFLREDLATRAATHSPASLDEDAAASLPALTGLMSGPLDEACADASSICERSRATRLRLEELDRLLAMVPDADAVAELIRDEERQRAAVQHTKAQLATVQAAYDEAVGFHEREEARLRRMIESQVRGEIEQEKAARVRTTTHKVGAIVTEFRRRILAMHADRISQEVLRCFRHLLRKERLIGDLRIDPETLRIGLTDSAARSLTPERLSAGERQLLAVSLLWGLARSANAPLPTVIDTPLGRLDSSHRARLLEHYFPHAGCQVLLLSTDEEIDSAAYKKLRPAIGRSYHIDYDESLHSSRVLEGYFWQGT